MVLWGGGKGGSSWECVNAVGRCKILHLVLAELPEACLGPVLNPVHPFGWHLFSTVNQLHHTQLGVMCKRAEGTLDPAVIEETVTNCYRLVTNSFGPSKDP